MKMNVFLEIVLHWTIVLTLSQAEFVSNSNNSPSPASTLSTQFLGPTFTSNFPKKILAPNTRATLVPCTVHAKPPATVQWFWYDEVQSHKGGGMTYDIYDDVNSNWLPVTQSTSAILDQLKNGSLLVSDFVEDSKLDNERLHVYRVVCKAWNSVGAIVSPAVHIRPVVASQYQMYTIQLMDVFTPVGNTAVFHCNINPYFMPEFVEVVTWQEENRDVIVTPGGRYSLMEQGDLKNGKLQVRNVSVSDSYKKFRCLTRNILTGKERSSNPAHLIVIEASNSPPRMTDHVSSMSATGGATVEVPCVAIAIPVARYRWSKNGIPIRGGRTDDDDDDNGDRTSGGSTRLVGGNLLIENVQVEDSGDYRCVAENYIGHQGTSVRLSVTAPLSVHIEPQLQTVDSGREAVLRCHVEGHPVDNITWLKDGKVLVTSSYEAGIVTEGEGGLVLRVEKVKRSDAGMYQCVVAGGGNEIVHASAQVSLGAFPPFILKEIPSEYLDPGTRVSMACSAIGNPRPTITWSVDGELLPSGQHGDRISVGDYVGGDGEVISHVNVTGAKVQDGGRYECLAANEMGEAREIAMLSVHGIPHIKPMRNITALAGSELEVTCRVTGYPVKEIFWKKGAQLLPTNHRQATSSNGSLLVSRLNRHLDEGWYSCHVINPNDQGMERRFYVRVIDPPKIDPFNFPLRKQGDRVSVSCVMSSGDLPMTLEWRKDGDVIDPDLGVQVHQSGSYSSFLSIEYATPQHNGNYTCIVTNEGATTSHTSQLHINVPPTWVSEPEDTSISLSATATIHCQAFGDPEPKIVWKKSVGGIMSSYRDIDLDEEDTRLTHLDNGTLVINSVAKEDQGFYLCHASNNIAPDLSKVVHLTVHVPASFKIHDSNVSVSSGETAVMECHSEGDLPTTLNWSSSNKGSTGLGLDPRYQVTYFPIDKGQGSRLTIGHVTKEDSGFYVCTAKNNYGSDVTSIHLMVLQLPDAPFELEVVAGVEWAELSWKEGFHGNSEIMEYLVEICRQGDSWKNPVTSLEIEASSRSVKVEKLKAATAYKSRVKARNKVGFGEASEVVTFDTLELEPSSPPLNVSAVAVGSQSVLVTWQPVPRTHENGRLLGYSIGYRRVNSSSPYLYVTVTNDNQRRLDDLEKFSTYSVHVRAFNGKGAGPMSEDVLVMTLEDVPSHAPLNVTARSQSSETISVTWSPPPPHSFNGVITGYKVIYKYVRDDEDESDSMSETTDQLSITLRHLRMFTNYSVQVLARTKIGEGIASSPICVTTLEDVPDPPEDMKVLVMNRSSLLVVWKKPRRENGILIRYFVNVTQLTTRKPEKQIEVSPLFHSHLLTSLDPEVRHVIKVGASTRLGDGKTTKEVIISTFERAEAKIAGFSRTLHFQWHNTVSIDCLAGGIPEPIITWEKGGIVVGTRDDFGIISMMAPKNVNKRRQNHRNHNYHTNHNYHSDMGDKMEILRNGTLVIHDLKGHDADEYKCQARNTYGLDEVTTTLVVQAPPSPPILMVTSVTSNSIQVTWKTTSNGGSKIKGFRLFKKLELGDWSFVDLDASNRSRLMTDLLCGSGYSFYIQAFNKLGMGLPSEEIKARTEGSAPIIPPQSMILDELNSTSATLTLTTWESGGCPITSFDLSYQVADDSTWKTVQKAIPSNTTTFTVTLNPGTWYVMRVTAHNDAGSTECLLRFSTLPYLGGSTVAPQHLVRKLNDFSFFSMIQKLHVIVPAAVAVVVVVVVVSVAMALYCYRKKNLKEADKVNSGLEVAMVVDDDVTGDQNENNEYENERREGKRISKKEEQNLLKRGLPKETQSHAVIIESEREVLHVTPNLAGVGTDDDDDDDDNDDDNDHHNLQWYARIPRDGFPDGSELQTAKNSSDDLHRFKCPPSSQGVSPISPPGCTCNALDSGHSTMVTTSGRSSAGESYRMLEPYGHHNHHRHQVPSRACVLSVDRTHNHPGKVQHHKERSSHEESLFQCHPRRRHQLQNVPPISIHGQSRCDYSCHDCNDAGSLYNQLTCTCSPDDCGLAPVEFPGLDVNRISRESEISFPPPPSSDYLSQQSSGVQNTPTDSHVTSPSSSDEYPGHLFHRRCDVMS